MSFSWCCFYNALQYASDNGVVMVAAAGNWGKDVLSHPASNQHVIGVSSVDKDLSHSEYNVVSPDWGSHTSPNNEIAAFGYGIKTTEKLGYGFSEASLTIEEEIYDLDPVEFQPLIPYTNYTVENGITAQLVYGGTGSSNSLSSVNILGKLVLITDFLGNIVWDDEIDRVVANGGLGIVTFSPTPGLSPAFLTHHAEIPVSEIIYNKGAILKDQLENGDEINATLKIIKDDYTPFSLGTSFATPQVSGAAVLLLSFALENEYNLTAERTRELLQLGTTDLGDLGRDDIFGFGLLNISKSFELLCKYMNCTLPVRTCDDGCTSTAEDESINPPFMFVLLTTIMILIYRKKTNRSS